MLKQKRRWLWSALAALVLFVGSITANLLSAGMEGFVAHNRPWLWIITVVAGIVTIIGAVLDSRHGQIEESQNIHYISSQYAALRNRYLMRIVDNFQYLPLRPVDFKSASAETIEKDRLYLADVYIAMDTTTPISMIDFAHASTFPGSSLASIPPGQYPFVTVQKAVISNHHVILLGDPGSGKSTFINYLALCLSNDQLNPRIGWLSRLKDWPLDWADILPVVIVLRDMAAWFQTVQPHQRKMGLLQAYLAYWLEQVGLTDFYQLLFQHLEDGKAILLLDGLDEVPYHEDTLYRIKEMIADLPDTYPKTHVVITCRVLSYQDKRWQLDANQWSSFELAKLNETQIDNFIGAWYNQLANMKVVTRPSILSAKLCQAVRKQDLGRLARNPLLLTVMAIVHSNKGELPDTRVLLYEDVVDLLLWRWEAVKLENSFDVSNTLRQVLYNAGLSDVDLKHALWALAFKVHSQALSKNILEDNSEATADIAEFDLLETLRNLHPEQSLDWANGLIQFMKLRSGLLVEGSPKVYRFPHRTFQEYLAGCHLSAQSDFTDLALALAKQGILWKEVIILAVGRWVYINGNIDPPLLLSDELCQEGIPGQNKYVDWRKIWLAGQCLLEIGLTRVNRRTLGEKLIERVREHLVYLISHDCLTPRERAESGSVLSTIGDPRNFDETILIPEGEFTMGSNDPEISNSILQMIDSYKGRHDATTIRRWIIAEKPQHQVFLQSFRISKYQITNSQYARFISATGHQPPIHWRGSIPPSDLLNHPVVNISWDDACDYCSWLSKQLAVKVRLPTEAEWEKAARGPDKCIYPWGNEFNPTRCNMADTGIRGTCPVGIFAENISPYGCFDMAGNVWEWTSTLNRAYPYNANDGREDPNKKEERVLRGGGFFSTVSGVRCAYRHGGGSINRSDLGFRFVIPNS